jgi:branched-chain amino acid transport system permease protein
MLVQFLANGIIAGSIYAVVALGFSLIYGTTRFFHFAHGAIFTIGAYLAYTFKELLGLPLSTAAIIAIILSAVLGISLELGIYRPLRGRRASNLILLIASLGAFIALQNLISLIFGDNPRSIRGGIVQEGLPILGARITPSQLMIIGVGALMIFVTAAIVKWTKLGKALRAVASDPELALVAGINSNSVILYAFAIGSALAAAAAILVSLDSDMTPTMGMDVLLMGVVAVIVGGAGSILGSALGGLLLGLAQHLGAWPVGSQWQLAIAFAILVGFLLLRPQGIFGRLKEMRV